MNLFEDNVTEFLTLLNKHGVRFILVGGLAVNYYGYSRTTGDVDLWLDDTIKNRKKLVAALKELNITDAETFLTYPLIAGFAEVVLDCGIYIDFMGELKVLKKEDFDESYLLAENFMLNEIASVKVLHIRKLIEEKSKSSRAKDKEDVKQLKKIIK